MKAIFKIEDLTCRYTANKPVLKIPSLEIFENTLCVIIGESGSGKSTLLEILGLMNNPFSYEGKIFFECENVFFQQLWADHQQDQINRIRERHFSFMFQNTNLMPQFSVYENIAITKLIQGARFEEVEPEIRSLLQRLGLQGRIGKDVKISQLSGGQLQRVAFARAVLPEYTVLFCDEPTGNLDRNNRENLMRIIMNEVKFNRKTSIIVSHNIEQTLTYADQVIIITTTGEDENKMGVILAENVFFSGSPYGTRRTWNNHSTKGISQADMMDLAMSCLAH